MPTDKPSLIFKRKLAFYPESFPTQELTNQFATEFQAGRISQAELSGLAHSSPCGIWPINCSLYHLQTVLKDARNGSV